MNNIDHSFASDEEIVVYQTRLHWITMLPAFVAAAGIGLLGLGVPVFLPSMSNVRIDPTLLLASVLGMIFMAGLIVAGALIKRSATTMTVTNRKVVVTTGVGSRHSIEIMFSRIESILVTQSLAGRLFNYGTVVVRGVGGTPEPFEAVADPLELRLQIEQQMDAERRTVAR